MIKNGCFYGWIPLLLLWFTRTAAQDTSFTAVPNCPCPEIYDLLKDGRGYIWMAHDFGLTRYDGRNYVNFGNPRENAVAVTDLWEDDHSRIWCHNFSGQIFYIDGFRMHLLDAYKFEEEPVYPRIGICGDELVATSAKGVFVLDTKTFKSRYYLFPGGSSSLTVLRGKVLLYGKGEWHLYLAHTGARAHTPGRAPAGQKLEPGPATAWNGRHRISYP